jgi:hypothetical protein
MCNFRFPSLVQTIRIVQVTYTLVLCLPLFQDFWIQTIHHVVTISLLVFSYTCNFVRVGAVILLVHDVSDVILEVKTVIYENIVMWGWKLLLNSLSTHIKTLRSANISCNGVIVKPMCRHCFFPVVLTSRELVKLRSPCNKVDDDNRLATSCSNRANYLSILFIIAFIQLSYCILLKTKSKECLGCLIMRLRTL